MKKVLGSGAAASLLVAATLPSDSPFHGHVLMPMMRLLDAESAHRYAILALKYNIHPRDFSKDDPVLKTVVWGKNFKNPIGLAAGFDKHAEGIDGLSAMGFGFVEIGSVTPLPQPGNPLPRMFRLLEDRAVINRYGFNSDGADVVAQRLQERSEKKSMFYQEGILGINLGKNKEQVDAAADYVTGLNKLGKFADYIVINVSSPNTPGLRSLQGEKELYDLISKVKIARDTLDWPNGKPPLLVKIAPDLTELDKKQISDVLLKLNVDGLIVSNTTISREGLSSSNKNEVGGLSGKPLFEKSTQALGDMYQLTNGKIPIIGVGGVSNGQEAYKKIRQGASLVQLYTSLSYEGPSIVPAIKTELAQLLKRDGFNSVSEAVGADFKKQ